MNSTTGAVRYRLINQSPGFEAVLVPLNGQSSPTIKFYAFAVMSYITRPDVISQMVLDPRIGACCMPCMLFSIHCSRHAHGTVISLA